MAFFSRFFAPRERTPLPSLEETLQARGVPVDFPGLDPHKPEFELLSAAEREHWGDGVRELMTKGWAMPPLWQDAQYDLAPRLVPTWMAERDGFCYKPYLEGLSLRLTACGANLPEAWLHLWGVTWSDVLDRAMDQLQERSQGMPFQRLPSGIYRGSFQDGHSAARFLLPQLWAGLFPGQNTFIAIPTEDELLVAPQVLLPQLVDAVGQSLAGPGKRLVATIYQQLDGRFLPANLQDPHPIAQPQRELRLSDLLEAYRAQEAVLPPEQGLPATPGMIKTQQGRAVSYVTWKEGAPVLLPDTDLIGFVAANGRSLGIYFRQTLLRIPELHGTLVDLWGPRRMRYESFPTSAQLERMECFATGEQMAELFKAPGTAKPKPATVVPGDQSGALSVGRGNSPVPAHLRGLSLGVQGGE